MSEEAVAEELDEVVPDEEKEEGVFYVSQIAPIEAEEEVKPQTKETAEGEEGAEEEDDTYTYQIEPNVTINPNQIHAIAQCILEERLKDLTEYDAAAVKKTASQISFLIREEIKRLCLDRYRIIANVTVGEKCNQDILMNFLCLWKPEFDHYAIAKCETATLFATALVFLIYKQ